MKKQTRDERELELYKFSTGSHQSIAHQYRRVKGHSARDLFEVPIEIGDAEVFYAEDDGRMNGIDLVGIGAIRGKPKPEREDAGEDKFG